MNRLFPLTVLLAACTLVGCDKTENTDRSFYIAGTWLGSHVADGAQRVVRFEENKGTANYVTSYFNPDYSKEELEIPFTFDEQGGDVVMNFSGIQNAAGISQIVLHSSEQESDIMAGLIHYSGKSHEPDTLLLSRMDEPFESEKYPESVEYLSNINMGPRSPLDELPKIGWENPFNNQPLSVNETDNIAAEAILLWVGKRLGTAAASTLASKLFNALWDEILPGSNSTASNIKQIVKDVEIIKKQLDEINSKLDNLIKHERLAEVTANLTKRNDTFIKLNSSVSEILRTIESEIKGADPEKASENIQKAILEWGTSVYDGNQLYNAVANYVNISATAFGYKSYPDLYDEFAYETIAWESDGYEWREMLRTTDEALVSITSVLTVMYWTAKHKIGDISESTLQDKIDAQSKLLEEMGEVYSDKAVVRHPDKMICQIYDFHKVFNKVIDWRHLNFPGWYPPSYKFDLNPDYLVFGNDGGLYMNRFMTEGEYNTLMKYYANEKGTLLSILKEIGFDINTNNPDATNAKMLLPNGARRICVNIDNFEIRVKKVITNSRKTDTDVTVGTVYAPSHLNEDYKIGQLQFYIFVFNKYVKYSDNTWFYLEVQQRLD